MPCAGGIAELKTIKFWTAVTAELLGTMLLIVLGFGSAMHGSNVLQVALAVGLTVATIVWCLVGVSGAHINPAVTATFLAARRISIARAVLYIVGQLLGAVLGSVFLHHIAPPNVTISAMHPMEGMSGFQAMHIETLITFVLLLTVFATCDVRRKGIDGSGPLAVGLAVSVGFFFAFKFTGAVMNPAAAFGTAVVSGNWKLHWVYWLGPLNGAVNGGLMYELMFATNASPAKVKAFFTSCDYDDNDFDETGRKVRPSENNENGQNVQLPTISINDSKS